MRADLSKRFAYDPTSRLFDLTVGGGALLDLGVYPATFAWLFLGRPDQVAATGSLAPTGSDLTVAMQWGYRDGRVAQLYCSAAANSPYTGLVCGTDGWLRFETRLHRPSALTVHTGDQAPTERSATTSVRQRRSGSKHRPSAATATNTKLPRSNGACAPASWRARRCRWRTPSACSRSSTR